MKSSAIPNVVVLRVLLLSISIFNIVDAFILPVPGNQTFDVVDIEYFAEDKVPGVAQCVLSKPLVADDIQRSEPELQCLHVPLLSLVVEGDGVKQKMADYCALGENAKVAKCSDIAELCEKKLNGKITMASESCSRELVRQADHKKQMTKKKRNKIREHDN